MKTSLLAAPCLRHFDPGLRPVLHADASDYSIGATLSQDDGTGLRPVAFFSRRLLPAESRYTPLEKELLAVVGALSHWRSYLLGAAITVLSDHESLGWLRSHTSVTSERLTRWREFLEMFDLGAVQYIKSSAKTAAGALSRRSDVPPCTLDPEVEEVSEVWTLGPRGSPDLCASLSLSSHLSRPRVRHRPAPDGRSRCRTGTGAWRRLWVPRVRRSLRSGTT